MKSLVSSKTFWFNILSAVGLIVSLPEFTGLLSAESVKYVVLFNSIINIGLRYVTTTTISKVM